MKIRQGFVSNSSTSSFIVIGWEIDRKPRVEMLKILFSEEQLNEHAQKSYFKMNWADLNSSEQDDLAHDIVNSNSGDFAILDNEEQGAPEGKTIIGRYIGLTSSDSYAEYSNQSVSEIVESLQNIPLDLDMKDLRIISGTQIS